MNVIYLYSLLDIIIYPDYLLTIFVNGELNYMAEHIYFGNSLMSYFNSVLIITAGMFIILISKKLILKRIRKLAALTASKSLNSVIDGSERFLIPLSYFGILYLSLSGLVLHGYVDKFVTFTGLLLTVFFGARFVLSVIISAVVNYWGGKEDKTNTVVLISTVIRVLVWVTAFLILLDNLGIKISGLIAGVGIGGVAIAFAAQSILGDVFNYFTIFLDRPFEIGDLIFVDESKGVVEHIGVKSTRIKSLNGEQLVFSNTDLTSSRVRNFKRMDERRVIFNFGVTYQTPAKKMKIIPDAVKEIIESIDNTRFERAHFYKFGDSSLDFEVAYYVKGNDYSVYMDVQQQVNISLMERLAKMKVDFAYPTRTLFIEK